MGCCGWARGRKEYFKSFPTIELQSTFYKLPKAETAANWRADAPEGFIYCLKAWQALTHPPSSPTWRRSGLKPEELEQKRFGWLRPTKDNLDAWRQTKGISEALEAKVCVLQCPPSFKFARENVEGMRKFLSKIDRGKLLLGWEPRGDWKDHPDEIRRCCKELGLIHVVDPLRAEPLSLGPKRVAYFRLHGFGKPSIYNYKYSDEELQRVIEVLRGLKAKEIFCMFNNIYMFEDARKLQEMVEEI